MTEFIQDPYGTRSYAKLSSVIVPVATTITLGDDGYLDASIPHCFLGVEMFADAAGTTPATATGGTFTVAVKTLVSPQVAESVPSPVIDAANLSTTSWAANTSEVVVTPAGITGGAAYYRVNLTQNQG